jgi:hypothetical protein
VSVVADAINQAATAIATATAAAVAVKAYQMIKQVINLGLSLQVS